MTAAEFQTALQAADSIRHVSLSEPEKIGRRWALTTGETTTYIDVYVNLTDHTFVIAEVV